MAILAPGTGTGSYPTDDFVPEPKIRDPLHQDFILGLTDTPDLPAYIPTSGTTPTQGSTYDDLKAQFLANINAPMSPPLPVSLPAGNPAPAVSSPYNDLAFHLAGAAVPITSRGTGHAAPFLPGDTTPIEDPLNYQDLRDLVADQEFVRNLRNILHPDISDPLLNQDVTDTINDVTDATGLLDGTPSEVFNSDFGSADTGPLLPPEMPGTIGDTTVPGLGQITEPTIDTGISIFGPGDTPTDIMDAFQDPSVFLNPDSPILPGFNDDGSLLPIDSFFNPPELPSGYGEPMFPNAPNPYDIQDAFSNPDTSGAWNPDEPGQDSDGISEGSDVVYQSGSTPINSPSIGMLSMQTDIQAQENLRELARQLQRQGLLY